MSSFVHTSAALPRTDDKRIEMKYLVDAEVSAQIKQWAREHLGVDTHCDPRWLDSYEVNTLYLDTTELDLFHRTSVIGRTKHRIRRYGNEPNLWLETKRKQNMVVRKSRVAVTPEEFARLHDDVARRCSAVDNGAATEGQTWCGDWFADRLVARRLRPAVRVHYRRFARTALCNGENMRLTIDSHLQAGPADSWLVPQRSATATRDIAELQILELKFHNHMPHLFKQLLQTFALPIARFSKYRTAIAACDLGVARARDAGMNVAMLEGSPCLDGSQYAGEQS